MADTLLQTSQSAPKFGTVFTDHMLKMEYNKEQGGWQQPVISKMENISLHPAAKVLHYATNVFEGMKAYRGIDGKIRLFRPQLNIQRLNLSAERACLPKVNNDELLRHIEKLIKIDESFIPFTKGESLYIRPTIIGTYAALDLGQPTKALLFVILSPCGSYFSSSSKPLRLFADPKYVRAWIGGAGDTKMGCNYAPTMCAQKEAEKCDCQQVMWLYGDDEQITEVGTMAIFAYFINDAGEHELRTAPLNGLVLPSITRRSLLELSQEWNEFKIVEDIFTMSDLLRLSRDNRLLELFGAGTACSVTPVDEIFYRNEIIKIPTKEQKNPLYQRFYDALMDIYYGHIDHPWTFEVGAADYSKEEKIESQKIHK